jgi:hypothetical protein
VHEEDDEGWLTRGATGERMSGRTMDGVLEQRHHVNEAGIRSSGRTPVEEPPAVDINGTREDSMESNMANNTHYAVVAAVHPPTRFRFRAGRGGGIQEV